MRLLKSERFELPKVYFITDRASIEEIPPGVPFIFGDEDLEPYLIRMLEYEILYEQAKKTGYPFNFKKILTDNGFLDIEDFWYSTPAYMEYTSEGLSEDSELTEFKEDKSGSKFKKFVRDSSVYVDIEKLKNLNVFPIWLDNLEKAIHTNIHNFAVYNNNMYNKKLEGMYGALDLVSPGKNLIIIDISGSIPKAVSTTCLTLAKTLADSFYSDLLITGSKSTLYPYEELHTLNVQTVYDENGMDNDQIWFKKIVTAEHKEYATAIVFGDNHSPCQSWSNSYNRGSKTISREDGKKLCKWKVNKVISFHTSNKREDDKHVAGYADWFEPLETEFVKDWVKYLN